MLRERGSFVKMAPLFFVTDQSGPRTIDLTVPEGPNFRSRFSELSRSGANMMASSNDGVLWKNAPPLELSRLDGSDDK